MQGSALSIPESHSAALRQLKILVLALIVSNIGLGIFGVYLLRGLDAKYTTLIKDTVPSINELQTLTAWSGDAMRATNPTLFTSAGTGASPAAEHARKAIERERDLRGRALTREWLSLRPAERTELLASGDVFTRESLAVLQKLESGRTDEATQAREAVLRPAFDRYVICLTKTADILEAEGLRTSGNLTNQAGVMSHMMLGIASWPIIAIGLFFVCAITFVAGVLLKVLLFPAVEA